MWTTAVIAGAMIMVMGMTVYADTSDSAKTRIGRQESAIAKLVEDGTISQATCDAIQAYMEQDRSEKSGQETGGRDGFLSGAVSEGIIDQDTADKLEGYMKTKQEERKAQGDGDQKEGRRGHMTQMWDEMLSSGVITQAQHDAIVAAMPQGTEETAE